MTKTPELWKKAYTDGLYTIRELFSKLVECSKDYPIPRIVAVLDETELTKFEEFVVRCASAESDDELVSTHYTLPWGLADVRKFVPYVVNGRQGTHPVE